MQVAVAVAWLLSSVSFCPVAPANPGADSSDPWSGGQMAIRPAMSIVFERNDPWNGSAIEPSVRVIPDAMVAESPWGY